MNPDYKDANNHISRIKPEDNWEELEELSKFPMTGIPPRRGARSVLPDKEPRSANVNDHTPKHLLKDGMFHSSEPQSQKSTEENQMVEPDVHPSASKKIPNQLTIGVVDRPGKSGSSTEEIENDRNEFLSEEPIHIEVAENETIQRPDFLDQEHRDQSDWETVTTARSLKHLRVNEIGGRSAHVDKRQMQKSQNSELSPHEGQFKVFPAPDDGFSNVQHNRWSGKKTPRSLRWVFYVGAGVISLLMLAIVLNQRSNAKKSTGEQSVYSKISLEDVTDEYESGGEKTLIIKKLYNAEDEAKKIIADYARSRTTGDFIGRVYRAEQNAKLIATSWTPLVLGKDWYPSAESIWSVLEEDGKVYATLIYSLPDFSTNTAHFRYEGSTLKLDWKATVGYCSANFSELQKGQGDASEIRAVLSPADFHTFALSDGEFRSFRLSSLDREKVIWVYTKIGGELEARLMSYFIPGSISGEKFLEIFVVLSLERGSKDTLPNQWVISSISKLGWMDD